MITIKQFANGCSDFEVQFIPIFEKQEVQTPINCGYCFSQPFVLMCVVYTCRIDQIRNGLNNSLGDLPAK
jgi:hypothetical protein